MGYLKEWKEDSMRVGRKPKDVAERLLSQETQHGIAETGQS